MTEPTVAEAIEKVITKKTLVEQLREDVSINDADIDGCMTSQASLYAHYSSLYAKAMYESGQFKIRADIAKARAYKEIRSRFIARATKYTEALLEAEVMLNESNIEAQELYNKYRMQETLAKEALEALKQRRDMLVQKGKSNLEERKGDLYLMGKTGQTLEEKKDAYRNRATGAS